MRISLLLDEDVQLGLAGALRDRGIDVFSVQEAGRKGLTDEEQVRFATANNQTIFTYNIGDFVTLHSRFIKQGRGHQGIVVSKQLPIGEALKGILNLVDALSAEDMVNRLEFLSNWRK
ncbi:MAG: DUF5615 family PIN-like protein [Chloroflexota bacterium]